MVSNNSYDNFSYQIVQCGEKNHALSQYSKEIHGILKDKGLNFRIHLRDTCGRQSFWIEPLGNCACEGRYDEMYQVVEEYLEGKGFSVQYDDQKMNFVV